MVITTDETNVYLYFLGDSEIFRRYPLSNDLVSETVHNP